MLRAVCEPELLRLKSRVSDQTECVGFEDLPEPITLQASECGRRLTGRTKWEHMRIGIDACSHDRCNAETVSKSGDMIMTRIELRIRH